jgi:hypothetical protein
MSAKQPGLNLSAGNPPTETREQQGVRLALKRMPQLHKRLQLIANLGNYPLGEQRIERLCETIDEWVTQTKVLLRNHSKPETQEFRFDK